MKKAIIAASLTVAAAGCYWFYERLSQKNEQAVNTPITNEYPYMKLIMTDGSIHTARELPVNSILVLYFPDCDHCQREATEISTHLKAFENYQLWFISTSPYPDIDQFAKKYKLAGHHNIHFVRTEMPEVINNFGGIPTPSLFIYSQERKLVKAFKGETKIEEIINHL